MPNKFKLSAVIAVAIILVVGIGFLLSNSESAQKQEQHSMNQLDSLLGKAMPEVPLFDADGKAVPIASLKGKNTLLFFNEGIMCYPACWDQMASLSKDSRFNNDKTATYAVVTDQPKDWQDAKSKTPELKDVVLLFDQNANASRQIGALDLPSSMHAGSMPGHTYLLMDKQGIVRWVYDDPRMAKNDELIANELAKLN